MSVTASKSLVSHNSLIRSIALGGAFIFVAQFIDTGIGPILIQKVPFNVAWQYIASGALGMTAF